MYAEQVNTLLLHFGALANKNICFEFLSILTVLQSLHLISEFLGQSTEGQVFSLAPIVGLGFCSGKSSLLSAIVNGCLPFFELAT